MLLHPAVKIDNKSIHIPLLLNKIYVFIYGLSHNQDNHEGINH